MRNLFYYVTKYKNKSFAEFPFNEVDSLLLSQLSYLNLEYFVPKILDNKMEIALLNELDETKIEKLCKDTLDEKRNRRLLNLLKNTTRYEKLRMNYFETLFNTDTIVQFCAVTFLFDEFSYIAYRGTDLSFIGWKEDFNLAFLDSIPSQEAASDYLRRVAYRLKNDLYLGGHSKGGNLALYSALMCDDTVKNRIIKIYDHDGPGFIRDIFQTEDYLKLESKIEKMTCKEALIGILLHHSERMKFVDSRGFSIFQHDPYNWKVTRAGSFKYVKNSNLISKVFEKTVGDFIESTSMENRKRFIDILFHIAMENPYSIIFDVKRHPISYLRGIHKRYKGLTLEEKSFFKKLLKRYQKIWRHNFKFYLKRSLKGNK